MLCESGRARMREHGQCLAPADSVQHTTTGNLSSILLPLGPSSTVTLRYVAAFYLCLAYLPVPVFVQHAVCLEHADPTSNQWLASMLHQAFRSIHYVAPTQNRAAVLLHSLGTTSFSYGEPFACSHVLSRKQDAFSRPMSTPRSFSRQL